ncbi:MAG: hypothetical protein V3T70_03920, partial [Phycisphaerae bacterium]
MDSFRKHVTGLIAFVFLGLSHPAAAAVSIGSSALTTLADSAKTVDTVTALPFQLIRTAASAGTTATTIYDFTAAGLCNIAFDHDRSGLLCSDAESFGNFEFSFDVDVSYSISGTYALTGGNTIGLNAKLTDLGANLGDSGDDVVLFNNIQRSQSTPGEAFVLGEEGGDILGGQTLAGSLTGTLSAGGTYRFEYAAFVFNFAGSCQSDGGAAGDGSMTLDLQPLVLPDDCNYNGTPDELETDTDGDGLIDECELLIGTNPLLPDTDGDGLLDFTEVDTAVDGCPDPLNPDSDGDTLLDGEEVLVLGTDPCNTDTDGDGEPDNSDPQPTDPGVTSGFIETELRDLATFVDGADLSVFTGPNANANQGRRNALCNRITAAANEVNAGNFAEAIDILTEALAKVDGIEPPPDWMADSPEKTQIA